MQMLVESLWHRLSGWVGHKFLMPFLIPDRGFFLKLYIFLQNRYQDVPITDCNNEQMSPFWGDKRSTPPPQFKTGGWWNTPFPIINCKNLFLWSCCREVESFRCSFPSLTDIPLIALLVATSHYLFTGNPKPWNVCGVFHTPGNRKRSLSVCAAPFWTCKRSETFSFCLLFSRLLRNHCYEVKALCGLQITDTDQTCGAHVLLKSHDRIYWWITEDGRRVPTYRDTQNNVLEWWKPILVVSSVHQGLQVWLARCQLQVWGLLRRLSATSKVRQ